MRTKEDLRHIRFTLTGTLMMDTDLLSEDPLWHIHAEGFNLDNPEEFNQALNKYLCHYLDREILMSDLPATCGPASIYSRAVEIVPSTN